MTETKQESISYTAQDHLLLKKVKELFDKLYHRRQLIRLVGIRFTDLIPGVYQINMYDDRQELIKLYQAVDSIKKQYGEQYVIRASGAENKPYEPIAENLMKAFKI